MKIDRYCMAGSWLGKSWKGQDDRLKEAFPAVFREKVKKSAPGQLFSGLNVFVPESTLRKLTHFTGLGVNVFNLGPVPWRNSIGLTLTQSCQSIN